MKAKKPFKSVEDGLKNFVLDQTLTQSLRDTDDTKMTLIYAAIPIFIYKYHTKNRRNVKNISCVSRT